MFAALLLPAIPVFAIGGVIITSDTPLVCCWTWAAVWAYRAIRSDDFRPWVLAGVIGALGVLAKYSVLALPASIGLYLLLSPRDRRQLTRPGFWMMAALCVGLGLGPIVAWNASHGWAGAGSSPIASGSPTARPGGASGRCSAFSAARPPCWAGSGGSPASPRSSEPCAIVAREKSGPHRRRTPGATAASTCSACGASSGAPAWRPACWARPRPTGWRRATSRWSCSSAGGWARSSPAAGPRARRLRRGLVRLDRRGRRDPPHGLVLPDLRPIRARPHEAMGRPAAAARRHRPDARPSGAGPGRRA